MQFKLTIDKMEDLKQIITDQITRMEKIYPERIEIEDIFYYSGLKKWTARVAFASGGKDYTASMDILENGMVTRYQQREKHEDR
jgi:predicted PP-loop superfamily ATPase